MDSRKCDTRGSGGRNVLRRKWRDFTAVWLCGLLVVFSVGSTAWSAIAFVQGNWETPKATQSSVAVTFNGAQTAGNLNVVIIAWNDASGQLTSLTDTKGNTYVAAVGPTISPNNETQYIFYAKNIVSAAAGANTVTAVFNGAVPYPDIRIAEYSGIDTANPLDGAVGSNGDGETLTSGSLTTTNANDLLVAGNELATATIASDPAFTQRMFTDDASILEDRIVTSVGTYSSTNTQDDPGWWVMQMAAFKAAGGGDTQLPSAPTNLSPTVVSSSRIDLSWTASTDNVGVTGYRIEHCAGAGCTNFTQVGTPTGTSFSDVGLSASTLYRYQVRAADAAGNLSPYSAIASATTTSSGDTDPPSAPTNLTATPVSSTQINLTWGLSTDNTGVTAYLLERCEGSGCTAYTQIASTSALSFSDTGRTPATNYNYRVRARDAVPNYSAYSDIVHTATKYAGAITYSYTYDALGRLKHVSGSDGSTIDYDYDANGNVTTTTRH